MERDRNLQFVRSGTHFGVVGLWREGPITLITPQD
jgi:hypothetical protein